MVEAKQQLLAQGDTLAAIGELVATIRRAPEQREYLVDLLDERAPLYQGRSANETMRLRGFLMAAFEELGLPDAALCFVLEELESGHEAYTVAAAARALRGLPEPSEAYLPFLLKAVQTIRDRDDCFSFDQPRPAWPLTNPTTALRELFRSIAWLGPHGRAALAQLEALDAERPALPREARAELGRAIEAVRAAEAAPSSCCGGAAARSDVRLVLPQSEPATLAPPLAVSFEDQEGATLTFGDYFTGTPAVVTFFYTRCGNPEKCSLTISKLARLQARLREEGLAGALRTAAISYDPAYDLPQRLRAYGLNRGATFSASDRFLRAREGFTELQAYFGLGVSFGPATVNHHRIELFVLDADGRIAATFARLQWELDAVLAAARLLIHR